MQRALRLFLLVATAGCLFSQTIPFNIRVQTGSNLTNVPSGAVIPVAATRVGATADASIQIAYIGATPATIAATPQLIGSGDFTVVGFPKVPLVLNPGDAFPFIVRYQPQTAKVETAQLNLQYTIAPAATGAVGSPATTGFLTLGFSGAAPDLVPSYSLQTNGNVVQLTPGSQIVFPSTVVNSTAVANFSVTNRGSADGTVDSISLTGDAYQMLGVPLLPFTLAAGAELRITLQYTPTRIETSSGVLQVSLGGTNQSFSIQGTSTGSLFAYEYLTGATVTPVQANGSVSMPDTALGASVSVAFRIRNIGSANGIVNSINLIGTGFALTAPPVLPVTLAPGATLVFTITFTPQQPGSLTGRLQIGNDSFVVAGRGIGPQLQYSYSASDTATTIAPNGSILFPPLTVGQTFHTTFVVHNIGTSATSVTNIGVVEPKSPFVVTGLPSLPIALQPDGVAQFDVAFTPQVIGFSTGTLRLDTVNFVLSGQGTTPPSLPSYQFSGPSGNVDPFQQVAVGLALSSPYSLDLAGTLTLSVSADPLTADPAVQFSTGGQSVNFTIPANTTQAVFANGQTQARLQTGTVAGTIRLTPTFATAGGSVDVTPGSPTRLQMTVPSVAPKILAARVTAQTTTGFTIAITGYSTPRALSDVVVNFTAATGFQIAGAQTTVNVAADAGTWYRSAASTAFGSQFTLQLPFTLSSNSTTITSPVSSLSSVSVVVRNAQGASDTVTIALQ